VFSRLMVLFALALVLLSVSGTAAPSHDALLEPSNSALNIPIEDIAASARGCAILDKDFPWLRKHPMYAVFKSMSLNQIAAMSHGQITPSMLAQARSD
jgi:hypothetical protein